MYVTYFFRLGIVWCQMWSLLLVKDVLTNTAITRERKKNLKIIYCWVDFERYLYKISGMYDIHDILLLPKVVFGLLVVYELTNLTI